MSMQMLGSLYIDLDDASQRRLHSEILDDGHSICVSDTEQKYKTPFLISFGREIVGFQAIRTYFNSLYDEQ